MEESIKVVILDNSHEMREIIKTKITDDKIKVVADFDDADKAYEYIAHNDVNIVVTDIIKLTDLLLLSI